MLLPRVDSRIWQIFNQVKYLVASGVLGPGEELPPIRALAGQLLINPNTVARAYLELEHAGIVVKRGTVGTFVSDAPSPFARRERCESCESGSTPCWQTRAPCGVSVCQQGVDPSRRTRNRSPARTARVHPRRSAEPCRV